MSEKGRFGTVTDGFSILTRDCSGLLSDVFEMATDVVGAVLDSLLIFYIDKVDTPSFCTAPLPQSAPQLINFFLPGSWIRGGRSQANWLYFGLLQLPLDICQHGRGQK